jgi:Secretion system C-terminal sorting domain
LAGATFPAYTNGTGTIQTYTSNGCTITTDGNVGWGGPLTPGPMANNPRNFNGAVYLSAANVAPCTSPARTVIVTVNKIANIGAISANQVICTDKVATFTVSGITGTGPFTYQWQVSVNNGPFTNISNGGVYSGATTATLTITAPPVTLSGNRYQCIVQGAAPCAAATSLFRVLTVNPLPTIVIAPVSTKLFPGKTVTLTSTVNPVAATYTWLRDGVVVGGNTPTLLVTIDGLGKYKLTVTDVNGCTNTSNEVTVSDSITGRCYIYPNPSTGSFQVRYYASADVVRQPRTLTVYDAQGNKILEKNFPLGRPYQRMDVDLSNRGKGLYWVEIGDLDGNRLSMCRVVIQ